MQKMKEMGGKSKKRQGGDNKEYDLNNYSGSRNGKKKNSKKP